MSAIAGFVVATASWGASLTADEIAARLGDAEQARLGRCSTFAATRRYFLQTANGERTAAVTARLEFTRDTGKTFAVISEGGNNSTFRRVIHKVLDGEAEASRGTREDNRIIPQNYRFELTGMDDCNGRRCYVLHLIPKRKSKFLMEGRAWVDEQEFAIVRLEGRPAASLSFWVGKPEFVQTFRKQHGQWLLANTHSVADVKLVGRTELTIEASDFEFPVRTATRVGQTHPTPIP
jgi:hypothetical protein